MTQYEFMKNWCKVRRLEPELHWPAAQRAWDATLRDSLTVNSPVTSPPEVAPFPVDPHADLKTQYEEDAKHSGKPWKWWEFRQIELHGWTPLANKPTWNCYNQYRRKADAPEWLPEPEPLTVEEWRTQRISGGGSLESTNRESGGTHQSPGSLDYIFKHIAKTNTLVSQLEGRIRIMDAQIQELRRTAK